MKRMMLLGLLPVFLLSLLIFPVRAAGVEGGVAVGGIEILKTNASGKPLEGAVFRIAREVRHEELTDQSVPKEVLKIGEENRIVTFEAFWDHREMTGVRIPEVTSDAQGKAAVYGLPYGTYYLVEAQAPEGYNRITAPIRVAIHKYSHLTQGDGVKDDQGVIIDNTLHIINIRYTLPDTGGMERLTLTAAIVGVVFSAAALLLMNFRFRLQRKAFTVSSSKNHDSMISYQ